MKKQCIRYIYTTRIESRSKGFHYIKATNKQKKIVKYAKRETIIHIKNVKC